ncbi:ABC transporter ATP-binding protein [Nocardiopsis flavescens]|uniref:Iron(III) transport system ATP-binding protein n=1 Tax=Nocardiopsis flavescens TaxID=758803 RepID=A0A1M6LEF9_9ACTN|nr:ABC transporter ATP-binding protein [Nocardiopsis flavescens]SHJ69611.1 iron(III) transport system ATP-binding protein [Nocardiopsis flavescens]
MRSGAPAASLTITDLRKDFGGTTAVDGISLEVPPGSFLVLLGPSGCGKTTTLRMLAGLEDPTGGEIRFGDRVIARGDGTALVAPSERGAGLVFQSYALWPHKTVRQNIEWPLVVARRPRAERRPRVEEVLEMLAISDLAERYPGEISGGQQQRVAIARMIAPEPRVLLFDEPLSNLDARLRVETRGELVRIHRSTGATSVYVTHDQVEAMTMATHIALMKDGRIEQFGTPRELLESPRTAFAATFIGTPPANIVECRVEGGRLRAYGVDCGPAPEGAGAGTVTAMYRAGSLAPAPGAEVGPGCLPATFADQVPMADRWVLGVDLPDGTRAHISRDAPADLRPGDALGVRLPAAPDAFFGAGDGHAAAGAAL